VGRLNGFEAKTKALFLAVSGLAIIGFTAKQASS
jgi:hypothetical protein